MLGLLVVYDTTDCGITCRRRRIMAQHIQRQTTFTRYSHLLEQTWFRCFAFFSYLFGGLFLFVLSCNEFSWLVDQSVSQSANQLVSYLICFFVCLLGKLVLCPCFFVNWRCLLLMFDCLFGCFIRSVCLLVCLVDCSFGLLARFLAWLYFLGCIWRPGFLGLEFSLMFSLGKFLI